MLCLQELLDHWVTVERAHLWFSPKRAYAEEGSELYGIGPNESLMYEITLLDFKNVCSFKSIVSSIFTKKL